MAMRACCRSSSVVHWDLLAGRGVAVQPAGAPMGAARGRVVTGVSRRDLLVGSRDLLVGRWDLLVGSRDLLVGSRDLLVGSRD